MTTWVALIILALGAMLLILNEPGIVARLDPTTFGYGDVLGAHRFILAEDARELQSAARGRHVARHHNMACARTSA